MSEVGKKLVRSTCHPVKYANQGKLDRLSAFIAEYRRVAGVIMDDIWNNGYFYTRDDVICEFNIHKWKYDVPEYLDYNAFEIETTLSGRAMSSLVTQLVGLLRSQTEKPRKRIYMFDKLAGEGTFVDSLWNTIESTKLTKPRTNNLNPELSSKCIDWELDDGEYDGFIRLSSIGDAFGHIKIPVKYHKHKKKYDDWEMMGSFLITDTDINFRWSKHIPLKTEGVKVGCDQGKKTVVTISDGQIPLHENKHGHSLESIVNNMAKKRPGSKAFRKAVDHRTNFVNWSIHQINFDGINEIGFEEIVNINYGKHVSRQMKHWTNVTIRDGMENVAQLNGVRFKLQSSPCRSQRCSNCTIVRKANRKAKLYECNRCGMIMDADLNASLNHAIDLPDIPTWLRVSKLNRKGFLWNQFGFFDLDGVELRVPLATTIKLD